MSSSEEPDITLVTFSEGVSKPHTQWEIVNGADFKRSQAWPACTSMFALCANPTAAPCMARAQMV